MVGKTLRLEWILAAGVKLLVYNWTGPEAETGQETGQSVTPNACPTEAHVLQQGPSTGCATRWALSVKIHMPVGENSPPTVVGVLEDRPKAVSGPGEDFSARIRGDAGRRMWGESVHGQGKSPVTPLMYLLLATRVRCKLGMFPAPGMKLDPLDMHPRLDKLVLTEVPL